MKLKRVTDSSGAQLGYMFSCPGCGHAHVFYVEQPPRPGGPQWAFNGDMNKPTFSPSLLCRKPPDYACHLFLRDGRIEYCSDCTHAYAGRIVDVPDFNDDNT